MIKTVIICATALIILAAYAGMNRYSYHTVQHGRYSSVIKIDRWTGTKFIIDHYGDEYKVEKPKSGKVDDDSDDFDWSTLPDK